MEQELWNLRMTGSDVAAYTTRFRDLAVLCLGMVTTESKKVERYIYGIYPQIQGNVVSENPPLLIVLNAWHKDLWIIKPARAL